MGAQCLLAYDVGTSGVKTSIVSSEGMVVDSQTESYLTRYAPQGIAEQNPLDWWEAICRTTNQIMQRNPAQKNAVSAIGVSGHMLGCIPVGLDGTPLLPGMIHSDSRSTEQFAEIQRKVGSSYLYQMSGNILDARSTLSKMLWVKQTRPEIYANTAKFLQCKDFIVAKLTGNIDTTDFSDACHGELMDINKRRYETSVYRELELDLDKLPMLHKSCDVVGHVSKKSGKALGILAGVPVIAGGGDGACGSAGAGNIKPGDAYLNLGSTAWIARVSASPIIDPQNRVFNIMNLDGESTSVFGTMQSAGSSVNWIQRLLGASDLEMIDRMASEIEPGCNGLVYLPYLDGERSPVFDAAARGVFAGMSQNHEPGHFARAVLEGVAYALRDITEILREFGSLKKVRAIGGGTKSEIWSGLIATICGLQLETLTVPSAEATSLGIAAAAGVAVGVFQNLQEALSQIRIKKVIDPDVFDSRYLRNFKAYQQIYPNLKKTMHILSRS